MALTVGAGWFAAADAARAAAEADLAALTAAVAQRQPLSTLHPAAPLAEDGDSLTLRRAAGWVNVPATALLRRAASGRFHADAPVELAAGSAGAPSLQFGADAGTGLFRPAAGSLAISTGGTERLRVAANGHVGIGLGAPTQQLEIYGGPSGSATNLLVGNAATGFLLGVDPGNTCQIRTAQAVPILFYTSGTERLRIASNGNVTPGSDNGQELGSAAMRWNQIYAASGTINTSDAREKAWRGPLTAAELRAAARIARDVGVFQWHDALAGKGPDGARLHIGVRAQAVWAIMADEGLVDPIDRRGRPGRTPYAFLCYDRWRGRDGRRRYDRFGVRVDQLALFLIAAQEARLAALEAAA